MEPSPESRARYQVITTLGQGGMARVLLTVSRGPAGVDKLLVVKELKAELKGDPEFLTMFLDEARIAARLNHPNVIQTYEVVSDGEHPLIVMEYLEGQSLSALVGRIGRKAMPLDLHLRILAQTAAGLHYAHELKSFDGALLSVVHRDVSPHNVFVTYDGLVKLVDFGIAKAADSAGLTRAGQFKGKVGYSSPEQLGSSATVDRRTDVFALGVMLWEALACRRLTFGEPEGAVMNRRLKGADPDIQDVVPDVPAELAAICRKAMAFHPDDRYATAAELRAALEGFLDGSSDPGKRAGSEQIGALVRDAFVAEREKIRGLVEARIRELAATDGPPSDFAAFSRRTLPAATLQVSLQSSPSAPTPTHVVPDSVDSTMKAASASGAIPPPERRFGRALIGVGLACAVAVTAVQLTRGPSGSTPAAAADSTTTAATASPPASPPPPAPAAATTIDVSIRADPREARIFLDDVALAENPFHGALPKSPLARRLRVTAAGYGPEERLVTLDRDINLELALTRLAAAPPLPAHPAGPVSPVSPAARPPAVGGPAAPGAPGPGEALANPTRGKQPRTIDTAF